MSEETLCGVAGCGRAVEVGKGGVLKGSKGTPECAMHHQRTIRNHPEAENPAPLRGVTPPREEKVTIRFTAAENAILERLAAGAGLDPATWCYRMIRRQVAIEVGPNVEVDHASGTVKINGETV